MHPILLRKRRLALYLLGWTPVVALIAAVLHLAGELRLQTAIAIAAPLTIVEAFICLSAWYPCRALPLARTSFTTLGASHMAGALLSSVIWLAVAIPFVRFSLGSNNAEALDASMKAQLFILFAIGILLYIVAVAIHYTLFAVESSQKAERNALELTTLAREAQLVALRAQINPHFLFNSLNSIASLCGTDPAKARAATIALGDFLRATLASGSRTTIPFRDEMSLVRDYLAIEKIRFGSRLEIEESIEPRTEMFEVPPLFLQPLVENAVVHGIAHRVEPSTIRISAEQRNGHFEVVVANECESDRLRNSGSGIGIRNVRERLERIYGKQASLETEETSGRFRTVVSVPLEGAR